MKRAITILSLLGIILFYSSCQKEDPPISSSNNLIDFTVSSNYVDDGTFSYVWLTDTNGNIIDYIQVENGNKGEFPKPDGFSNELFSLHRLIVKEDGDYSLYTYTDIKAGDMTFGAPFFKYGENLGTSNLNFSNIPSHDEYFISSWFRSYSGEILSQEDVAIHENANQVYLYLRNGNTGYYRFMNNLQVGQIENISLSDISNDMTLHNISFPDNNTNFISIRAYEKANKYYGQSTLLYSKYNFSGLSSVSFHTPNIDNSLIDNLFDGSLFKSYRLYFSSTDSNNSNKRYSFNSYGQIPQTIKYMNADIQVQSSNFDALEVTTTGNFDYFRAYYRDNADSVYKRWYFYSATGKNIVFPQIPTEISQIYPQVKKENVITEDSDLQLSLIDASNTNSYNDYLELLFLREGKGLYSNGIKNSRSVYYLF